MNDAELAWRTLVMFAALFAAGPLLIAVVRLVRRGPSSSASKAPLWLRYVTLLALSAAFLGAAWLGRAAFALLAAALAAFGTVELWRVCVRAGMRPYALEGTLAAVAMVVAAAALGPTGLVAATGVALLVLAGQAALPARRGELIPRLAATLFGTLTCGLLFGFMVCLRGGRHGFGAIVFLYGAAQLHDVFSMLGGLAFGTRKFAPVLSPGKTWGGTVTGLLFGLAAGPLFGYALPALGGAALLGLSALLALTCLAGGLIASALKRGADLKDFGSLFPGHGGVIDRFDSVMAASLVLWIFLELA